VQGKYRKSASVCLALQQARCRVIPSAFHDAGAFAGSIRLRSMQHLLQNCDGSTQIGTLVSGLPQS
jgi:hypothetical protein